MKNKNSIMAFIFMGTLIAGGLSLTTKSFANTNNMNSQMLKAQTTPQKMLTQEEATQIVLKENKNAQIYRTKLDRNHGRLIYEIDIYDDKNEKEYEIDAFSGQILKMSSRVKEIRNFSNTHMNHMENGSYHMNFSQIDTSKLISMDEAKKIALKNSPKATITSVELDSRRGLPIYEVEFLEGNVKREYEIDATNGNIVKFDEKDYSRHMHNKMYKNNNGHMNNNVTLSMEDAIKIALDNSKNGTIDDIEFKIKKGIPVYEVEVKESIGEKEFIIDANSGKILKQKRDF